MLFLFSKKTHQHRILYIQIRICTEFQLEVGLSPSKKISVIYFIESPLKTMKNAFDFILKALFVLKIFNFLSWLFGHVEKTAYLER